MARACIDNAWSTQAQFVEGLKALYCHLPMMVLSAAWAHLPLGIPGSTKRAPA